MTAYFYRLFGFVLLAGFGTAFTLSAQAVDRYAADPEAVTYDYTDIIYDEVGCKLNLHLQYDASFYEELASPATAGGWYVMDYLNPKPGEDNLYQGVHEDWRHGHALCSAIPKVGGWHLFRSEEAGGNTGPYAYVIATPVPGEWHELSQVENRPADLYTNLPQAVQYLLGRSTGYRELVWWRPCSPVSDCRLLAHNR